jgi:hypothetical protein
MLRLLRVLQRVSRRWIALVGDAIFDHYMSARSTVSRGALAHQRLKTSPVLPMVQQREPKREKSRANTGILLIRFVAEVPRLAFKTIEAGRGKV